MQAKKQQLELDREQWASLVAQMVKHLPTMWDTRVQSLDREDPLEKEMATHSSTLVWKIPWTEEPGRLQSMGSQSQTQLCDSLHFTSWNNRQVPNWERSMSRLYIVTLLIIIMQNSGLDEAQAGIKIAGRNINNFRYADDTTLMEEREEN